MSKPKVLVTGIVSESGLTELKRKFEVTYSKTEFNRSYILKNLFQFDALLLMGQKADRELLDAGTHLKIISLNGVGYDHVDINYAREKGIVVSNSPEGVRIPTAEMTMALILGTAKRLHLYDKVVRSGDWLDVSKSEFQGITLNGRVLGIFGMGRIGKTVAKLANAFGMNIIYNDAYRLSNEAEASINAKFVEFDELLNQSDVISIHAPLLDSTKGIFNLKAFKKMKSTSFIINAARGPIIHEANLITALTNNEIAGAGLDVFEFEPEVSETLRKLDNALFAPHAGTGTVAARHEIAQEAANNIISFFDGEPINVVNP
ncbi:NAD(P)-dependent oxidoreductase [Secundilactobacillus mixtipabuli]|uniref:2-hydroxyacid dehydrogenase n=1 Tax=Secundilactobacillus mixtipabuli TaxID=1435342 RepID=A0A1Z5IA66_9LACO|nr:NAD(P)-dependent oxidoreductase [Secundilactobacillus mixtipabuli]GAW98511.1 2-hydroxyacid dehydrogenase [Secundilactobacillus mixtipabuli]